MKTHHIGIIMNGVTGRMGSTQHLARSIMAIRNDGGIRVGEDTLIIPEPALVGRSESKLRELSEACDDLPYSTNLQDFLDDDDYSIYFDAQVTSLRFVGLSQAMAAGKHVYAEKPVAHTAQDAIAIAHLAEDLGMKNGVVQDKLWLPGMVKLHRLINEGFFGRILSVRAEFGYWVFTGEDRPAQRPSWNYRKEDGGGLILDMFAHWRYLIDALFGNIESLMAYGATHIPERIDENGNRYECTADDAAYAMFKTASGVLCQFNSSWCTRVRRDDLLTLQVDGTQGSAVAGLRDCWVQALEDTPRPVWNPDAPVEIDYFKDWTPFAADEEFPNAFRAQWERFLRHVALDEEYPWTLREGAKGVQLAELALESWKRERWVAVPEL